MGKNQNKTKTLEKRANCKYLPLARDFSMLTTLAMTMILAQQLLLLYLIMLLSQM